MKHYGISQYFYQYCTILNFYFLAWTDFQTKSFHMKHAIKIPYGIYREFTNPHIQNSHGVFL